MYIQNFFHIIDFICAATPVTENVTLHNIKQKITNGICVQKIWFSLALGICRSKIGWEKSIFLVRTNEKARHQSRGMK
jgi:hypothetical protein